MNGYLLSIIGTVLICSMLTAIAPEGKTSAVIKGIAKLACVLAIIAPVLRFFQSGSLDVLLGDSQKNSAESVIQADQAFIQYYSEKRVQETEQALSMELLENFETRVDVCFLWSVQAEELSKGCEVESVRIEQVRISLLQETTEEVKRKMREHVEQKYCSEVLIE